MILRNTHKIKVAACWILLSMSIVLLAGSCKGKAQSEQAQPQEPIEAGDAGMEPGVGDAGISPETESEKREIQEALNLDAAGVTPTGVYHSPVSIGATSFLTEGSISYGPENLAKNNVQWDDVGFPWVEGVAGDGIGESVTLRFDEPMDSLHVWSGYIDSEKPDLYQKNNRPKELLIQYTNTDGAFVEQLYILEDSPNQMALYLEGQADEITLTIASVYKGTKWNDTCITQIRGFTMGLRP